MTGIIDKLKRLVTQLLAEDKGLVSLPQYSIETLPQRLQCHLDDFLCQYNSISGLNVYCDRVPRAYPLAEQARHLAFELSLIPGYKHNPVLLRANDTLTKRWQSVWSNIGVTEAQYRLAIKSVLVYLAIQEQENAAVDALIGAFDRLRTGTPQTK